MASFKAKFPLLQELFAKNHRVALWAPPPPSGARVKRVLFNYDVDVWGVLATMICVCLPVPVSVCICLSVCLSVCL